MNKPPRITYIDMPETLRERYQYHTEADMTKIRSAGCRHEFLSLENGVQDYVNRYFASSEATG